MAKKGKGSTAVADDELVLEDEAVTVDEEQETPAAKSNGKAKKDEITFGVADLCKLVVANGGKEYSTRDMRALIRKMAREETPRVNRVITPGNRTRYDWSGPTDPEVLAIVAAVTGGEIETAKTAALAKLKADKAAKKAADPEGAKAGKKGKGKKGKADSEA